MPEKGTEVFWHPNPAYTTFLTWLPSVIPSKLEAKLFEVQEQEQKHLFS